MERYCHDHLEKNEAVICVCKQRRILKPAYFLLVRDEMWNHYQARQDSYVRMKFRDFKKLISQVLEKKLFESKFTHPHGNFRDTPIITGVKFKDPQVSMTTRAEGGCVAADHVHEAHAEVK